MTPEEIRTLRESLGLVQTAIQGHSHLRIPGEKASERQKLLISPIESFF
jgi:hypothetical protein